MSKLQKRYHFIYKTINLINGKYYIGMHSTYKLDDGYLGSGTRLRRSIRKYGKQNFNLQILEFLDTRDDLIKRERELINEEVLKDSNCLNIKLGGCGGFIDNNHQFKCSSAAGIKHRDRLLSDLEYRLNISEKRKNSTKIRLENNTIKTWKDSYSWKDKKHTEYSKKIIGEKNSIQQKGEKNSQFGSFWITDGINNKKLKKDSNIPSGWWKGRIKK